MDDAGSPGVDLGQRSSDLETLLGIVETRSLTAEQSHSACALLFGDQGSEHSVRTLIASVACGVSSLRRAAASPGSSRRGAGCSLA